MIAGTMSPLSLHVGDVLHNGRDPIILMTTMFYILSGSCFSRQIYPLGSLENSSSCTVKTAFHFSNVSATFCPSYVCIFVREDLTASS